MSSFWKYAFEKNIVSRSIKVALFVGSILAVINHYDGLLSVKLTRTDVIQILITYLVPYAVATYGAAMQTREIDRRSVK